MKRMVVLALTALVLALSLSACDVTAEQEAVSFVKKELGKVAKQLDAEISNMQADTEVFEVSPADKANGLEARTRVNLRYATRCPNGTWSNSTWYGLLEKTRGKWSAQEQQTYTDSGIPLCRLAIPARDWRQILENRRLLEEWFQPPIYVFDDKHMFDPAYASMPSGIRKALAALGPTWAVSKDTRPDLERILGRSLSEAETSLFQTDEQKAEEFVRLVEQAEGRGALKSGIAALYRLSLTHEGRKQLCTLSSIGCSGQYMVRWPR